MKAFTVWQPWASLIALGFKPHEFRKWAAPKSLVGQRLGIHAGVRPIRREEIKALIYDLEHESGQFTGLLPGALPFLEKVLAGHPLPHSAVVCSAIVGTPIIATHLPGAPKDSDRDDHSLWAWPMLEVEHLHPPDPCKRSQGFWNWRKAA